MAEEYKHVMYVDVETWDKFFDLIERNPETPERLRQAAKHYKMQKIAQDAVAKAHGFY